MTKTSCFYCRKAIPKTVPRVTIEGHWACEDCAYLIEYGPSARRIEAVPKPNPLRPQAEELFPDTLRRP